MITIERALKGLTIAAVLAISLAATSGAALAAQDRGSAAAAASDDGDLGNAPSTPLVGGALVPVAPAGVTWEGTFLPLGVTWE